MLRQNIRLKCFPVSGGMALGEVQVVRDSALQVVRRAIAQPRVRYEIDRLDKALEQTVAELRLARKKAVSAVGEQGASVFDAQVLIASDQSFFDSVKKWIQRERVNAEYAFQETLTKTLTSLQQSRDPYLRQMINDIQSVSGRILALLLGVRAHEQNGFARPTILVGRIFSPGEIIAYSKRRVVGVLTEEGGPASHMGLIIRSLGIPAVMADFEVAQHLATGMTVIIDGNGGEIIINPDKATWSNYRRIGARKQSQPFAVLHRAKAIRAVTRDGRAYQMGANLEIPGPLDDHLVRLGIGIGLFRTEFLYFRNQAFPSEDEQVRIYSDIAHKFHPLPVTIRTFDLGGDKYAEGISPVNEDNPALGWRGIRVALEVPRQYKIQLRAVLRASAAGNLRIMFPMISRAADVTGAQNLLKSIKRELKQEGIPFDPDIKVGIMMEVPSAALQADYLAEMVDFFSIGTNDLIQYTLAADRGNHRVAAYYNENHPAVLKLIQMIVVAAHDNNIPVSVCGELAGDKNLTPFFVGLGVDELSMNPTLIPGIADWISRIDYVQAKRFVSRVLRLTTSRKVERAFKEAYDYIRQQKKGSWMA